MKIISLKSAIIVAFITSIINSGCGGEGNEKKEITDGKELGEAIFKEYQGLMDNLFDLFNKNLPVVELKTKWNEMREKSIQSLVNYGKMKLKMSERDKNTCNSTINLRLLSLDLGKFTKINDKIAEIRKNDNDLANNLAEYNIITQYADFELLKKQKPGEIKRLGLDNLVK